MKPHWQERPTSPGLWLREIDGENYVSAHHIKRKDIGKDIWAVGSRFYGPIPPDTEE